MAMLDDKDFDSIRDTGDRSHSLDLLQAMQNPGLPDEVAHQVVRTLIDLDDPRCLLTLRVIAEDLGANAAVRSRALSVLCESMAHPTGDDLRQWWNSGDEALMSAAVPLMDRSEADILTAVLEDPDHSRLADALFAIAFGFQEPIWQLRKVRYLTHPDSAVRAAAARCVFWDEPLIAEATLVSLLTDDDPEVAAQAAASLAYYPSRKVALALSTVGYPELLRESQSPDPSDGVLDAFRWVLTEEPDVALQMRDWMGPVALLPGLTLETAALGSQVGARLPVETEAAVRIDLPRTPSLAWSPEWLTRIQHVDEPLQTLLTDLRLLDAESVPAAQRMQAAAALCRHADANLREVGALVASQLNLAEPLMELFDDPCIGVRKSAVYYAHDLSMNAMVAERVLAMIERGEVASTRGREALRTWVRHVDPVHAHRRLIRFARDDQRESIVVGAIEELVTHEDSADALRRLSDLLHREPLVTWAVHVTLLDAYARVGNDAGNIDHLRVVDNVWLATAIAKLDNANERKK